jgi:hypothetical protein
LVKLDSNGSLVWERNHWGQGHEILGIATNEEGYMIVEGWGLCLLKIDEEGNRIWERRWEGHAEAIAGDEELYVVAGIKYPGPRAHLLGFKEVVPESYLLAALLLMLCLTYLIPITSGYR